MVFGIPTFFELEPPFAFPVNSREGRLAIQDFTTEKQLIIRSSLSKSVTSHASN